jgi:hypothetical protein
LAGTASQCNSDVTIVGNGDGSFSLDGCINRRDKTRSHHSPNNVSPAVVVAVRRMSSTILIIGIIDKNRRA